MPPQQEANYFGDPGVYPEPAASKTPEGSSFGSDALKIGASLAPTIASGVFSRKRRKLQSEARHFEKAERLHGLTEGLTTFAEQEGELRRQGEREPSAIKARLASAGASGGSQEASALSDQKYNMARRFNSLQRARARLQHGYDAGEKLADLQRRGQRLEENEAKLAAFIDVGMKVAGAAV
jgi:hypothetical protein